MFQGRLKWWWWWWEVNFLHLPTIISGNFIITSDEYFSFSNCLYSHTVGVSNNRKKWELCVKLTMTAIGNNNVITISRWQHYILFWFASQEIVSSSSWRNARAVTCFFSNFNFQLGNERPCLLHLLTKLQFLQKELIFRTPHLLSKKSHSRQCNFFKNEKSINSAFVVFICSFFP